jgi:FkbM family methyltransferase
VLNMDLETIKMQINSFLFQIELSIRDFFRIRTLPSKRELQKFLGSERVILADVGATGNPKGVWREAEVYSRFILFDPDPRASIVASVDTTTVFPGGLWSGKGQKTLTLAANPEASTCFNFNSDVLDEFLNADLNRSVGEVQISVDTMDNVLSSGNLWPDFIKVDAEGADLEILKGAENALAKNCFGVFVEVSFAERHKGAPLFGEIDKFLRERNFILMDIFPERWIRKNNVTGIFTRHQVVWGDALFVISRAEFLRRMGLVDSSTRRSMFAKFLFILMLYQLYDYADEIIEQSYKNSLITHVDELEAKKLLESAMGNATGNIFRLVTSIILSSFGLVLFLPVQRRWQNNLLFFRIQFGELCNVLLRFSMRRYDGCVADPVNPSSRL